MSLGGFLDSSSAGARVVADIPYGSTAAAMPAGVMSQARFLAPSLPKSIFSSPSLSLALQTNLEGSGVAGVGGGQDEMMRRIAGVGDLDTPSGGVVALNGGTGAPGKSNGNHREEDYESRSGSDNMEGGSGDDLDPENPPNKKKRYHRHTPWQIQELEALFKECPHPDEKQRLELSKRLSLESRQVKFWFQNRRTQMKNGIISIFIYTLKPKDRMQTQLERHENALLRQENEKLKVENMHIRESMRNPICQNCGGPATLGQVSLEQQQLRLENARLRDELDRVTALAGRFIGRPIGSLVGQQLPPHMPDSSLELAVGGGNGFPGLCPVPSALTPEADFVPGMSSAMPIVMPPTVRPVASVGEVERSLERSMLVELALVAMDELVKLAQMDEPLWVRDGTGKDLLNGEEYLRVSSQCIGPKPVGFVSEATRETGVVIINSSALVETLMDVNRWPDMFPSLIAKTTTTDVIYMGMGGTRNGTLQLMRAELQVLSPLVPIREVSFLRYCKELAQGVWAVVDVSVDSIRGNLSAPVSCRRLPSGCLVQDMPNGYSKVTWVEHAEYDETGVHPLYRPLLRSGLALGAQRWVATLQRQCECLAVLMSSVVPGRDLPVTGITAAGRRSMLKLAQRMTANFCAGVCASSVHTWAKLNMGAVGEDVRVMTRKSENDPGEPPGVVLSAATSVWLPVPPQRLFDFLRNESLRSEWDILSNGGPMQEMAHIAKGQDQGNAVSLLRASAGNASQSSMLILQETCTDSSGSLVVYAPVDIPAMHLVMTGGDSSCVALLPSGFAISPDGPEQKPRSGGSSSPPASANAARTGGSLLTVAFQILVNSLPTAKLTVESVETVNNLISCTVQKINIALHCDN
ncbi:hypothetical protein Taro_053274 [Colocasia esculenta]|uniref:Homeobox-leucine zipper protein ANTHOCYANINLESS 2 n=1 Tax=Colocasia esculenta TaxID=4460 RepID=A0A843XLQ1_COLES|nr:hypothetical protein [Colocasia esculenta]